MSWILFSILAALIWAIVNIIDKYVLMKWIRKPIIPVMFVGLIGLIASLFIYLFRGFSPLSSLNILLAFIAGVFYVLMCLFYFKALKIEEVSRVIALFYLAPLFILILATIFLGEVFTPLKYIGIFLLVIGAILISSRNFIKISFSKAFWLMILCVLSSSISAILTKYLLNFTDYWTVFAYARIGTILALIPVFYFYFPELIRTVKIHGKRVVCVLSANEILNLLAVLFLTIAVAIGYVTLAHSLVSIQPFFILIFVVILSIFYPQILKEEITKKIMVIKLIAIIIMFVGAILITQ